MKEIDQIILITEYIHIFDSIFLILLQLDASRFFLGIFSEVLIIYELFRFEYTYLRSI